jgi:hypothetical protein
MDAGMVLGVLAIICALTSIGFGVRIASQLRSRGIRANPLLVRWMIFKYLAEYKRVTLEEAGRVGPLHRACTTALILAAVFAIGAIIAIAG